MELLNRRLPAVGCEKVVKRFVLIGQLGFAYSFAVVEEDAGSTEDFLARTQRLIGNSGARRCIGSKKRIALQAAAQRVEESTFEVAMHAGQIVVVGALVGIVLCIGGIDQRGSLIFIMKADERDQVRRELEIALVSELIAIRDLLVAIRIGAGKVLNRLARDGVAVGAGDGQQLAQGVSVSVIIAAALLRPLRVLLALAGSPVANRVMKGLRGLVIDGSTDE